MEATLECAYGLFLCNRTAGSKVLWEIKHTETGEVLEAFTDFEVGKKSLQLFYNK